MAVLTIFVFADLLTLPIPVRTNLVGASACGVLGLLSRFMVCKFEAADDPDDTA